MSSAQPSLPLQSMPALSRPARLLLATSVVILAAGTAWLIAEGWTWRALLDWQRQVGSVPYFIGMALLPLVGVPTTPLFMLAGASFGLITALIGSAVAVAANVMLSYWLARKVIRRPLAKLLRRWDYQLPEFTPGKALSFLILMRLAPGLPAFLKNYVTALFDVPFGIYLALSWLITYPYAVGLIVLGDSLFSGDLREGAAGLLVLLAVVVGFGWINKRQQALFDDRTDDKISALKSQLIEPLQARSAQALTWQMLKMMAGLMLFWAVIAENSGWAFASEAIIVAVLISLYFSLLWPTRFSLSGLALFLCYFLVEALRGGLDVAWRALHPRLPITPGWVDYPLSLPPGAPRVLFLNSVSLLPGTLSVALQGDQAVVHSLGTADDANTELARLEYWVMRVFIHPARKTHE